MENNFDRENCLDDVFNNIVSWGRARGFYKADGATLQSQLVKLVEEQGELAGNIARGRDIKDDIGDMIVVLTHMAKLAGTDIKTCVEEAYNEIKDRKGMFINGTFIKESDLSPTLITNGKPLDEC